MSQNVRESDVRAEQIHLLYSNALTGIAVTVLAVPLLAYLQSSVVSYPILAGWVLYMLSASVARLVLVRNYLRKSLDARSGGQWGKAFAVVAGLTGFGWGAAGILLFPETEITHQMFLVFVLGGMMLGGASLLAARPESFVAFLVPSGLLPALRLLIEGDKEHVVMGILSILFTAATLTTAWRFYLAIDATLKLRFQNQELLEGVQIANSRAETLNQELELRVHQRTEELHESNARLRSEIKHREQMEQDLLRIRNLESLGVLAGGIAHDFNNFLTIVQGNVELAKLQLPSDSPTQGTLEDCAKACQRASGLSGQLLTFAKGGAPIRRVVFVSELILNAVHLAQAGSSTSIVADIAGDLWPASIDVGQINQVLHNILLNARQAMPEGGIVQVRADNVVLHDQGETGDRAFIRISVRDSGTGIPAEVLPHVFDPYFTTKHGGRGLGLATAHTIVSKHGGQISVNSKTGEGTEFIILLPSSSENPESEPVIATPLRKGTGKVVVMDDEEALRALLDRTLTRLGYEVQSARDGAEAVALYQTARNAGAVFDAVLLDLTVNGGMGGVEAAGRLKELDPSLKLIVSSGYTDAAVMSKFREYGFDDVVVKPWETAELSAVFQRVLTVNSKVDTPEGLG
jgi:signal transduction histidine kinase/CheY-like chemotaxis protein